MAQITMEKKFKKAAGVICLEWCPTDAISLNEEELAQSDEKACLGCGVCSRFCPEEAISLKEGLRRVFILPPRLRKT